MENLLLNNLEITDYTVIPFKMNCKYCNKVVYFNSIFHFIKKFSERSSIKVKSTNLENILSNDIKFFIQISLDINLIKDIVDISIAKNSFHYSKCINCKNISYIKIKHIKDRNFDSKLIFPNHLISTEKILDFKNYIFNKNFIKKYCSKILISENCKNEKNYNEQYKKDLNFLYSFFSTNELEKMMLYSSNIEYLTNNKITEYFFKNKMYNETSAMIDFFNEQKILDIKYINNASMRENSYIMLKNILFNKIKKSEWNNFYSYILKVRRIIIQSINIFNKVDISSQKKFYNIVNKVCNNYNIIYNQNNKKNNIANLKNIRENKARHEKRVQLLNENLSKEYILDSKKITNNYDELWNSFLIKEYCLDNAINNIDPTLFT